MLHGDFQNRRKIILYGQTPVFTLLTTRSTYTFENLGRFFFASFGFSAAANLLVSILTFLFVFVYRVGYELNPVMIIEARVLGSWLIPAHMISVIAYYMLFYVTMNHYAMTKPRFVLWITVLVIIPILSACDLAFDIFSIIRIS